MKKVILVLCAIFACANTTIAQVTVSRSELVGTKWQVSEVYERHESSYYEFTNKAFIWHCNDGTTHSSPFYLSKTIPTRFDSTKVGVSTKGCYIIEYNDKLDYFYCYAIMSFDKSSGEMTLKLMNKDVIGLSDTVTFILKK